MSLRAGTRLGPYEILAPLGAGGMGEVYRARDTRLEREVAVKVLAERLANDPEALSRFRREAKAIAALSHPNILAIHDFGTENGIAFAVMELLEGESLRTRLLQGPVPWKRAVEMAIAVADGLAAAHAKGIVHRDLKPDNVFVTPDDRVKILDFGLARREDAASSGPATAAPTATATDPQSILGTLGYMAPEQVRGDPVDGRTDIFSFGCLLHELASGRRAFQKRTGADTIAAILNAEPDDIAGAGMTVPQGLISIVARCLQKNPASRFQTANDLAFALKEVLRSSGEAARPPISSGSHRRPLESIAVLPFANVSGDPDAEYLSDGIAESIIHGLSRLPNLRVMARSTLSRYKGQEVEPQRVGQELNVRAVVAGRVFHRGDSLVVKTELVDVSDGSQIWGENYNRKFADILALEEDISREISAKLRLKVTGEEAERLTRRATESTAAHRLYLRGRFFLEKRAEDSLRKAIEHFQQAVDEDPEYALAHAGIAECFNFLGFYGHRSPADSFPKAKAAATRALEHDPALSEALAARGVARFYWDWDWKGTEADFKEAIAVSPSYANARQFYAIFLASQDRFDECFPEVSWAEELDPLSLPIKTSVGYTRFLAGRFEESISALEAAIEIDPTFVPVRNVLSQSYAASGRNDRSIEEAKKVVALSGRGQSFLATLGLAFARAGLKREAEEILRELEEMAGRRYVSSFGLATIHVSLGTPELAFSRLDQAYRERDWSLALLRVDPRMDPLRADPRFGALIRRVGLPATQAS
jgi:serine/threonine protein kinase/Tfp pilus assembly protein PilF